MMTRWGNAVPSEVEMSRAVAAAGEGLDAVAERGDAMDPAVVWGVAEVERADAASPDRYQFRSENDHFAQSHRCIHDFYPRNIVYMPAVKISYAPRS